MKFVIFSDIHGNIEALQQMLKATSNLPIGGYIFCGDLAGYLCEQEEIVDVFKSLKNFYAVLGNHDVWYIEATKDKMVQCELVAKLGESYCNLSEKVVDFLKSTPRELDLNINGKHVGVFHNIPGDIIKTRLFADTKIDENIFKGYDIVFLGHTHSKMKRKIGNTLAINPGSLGIEKWANAKSYAVFDFADESVQFFDI